MTPHPSRTVFTQPDAFHFNTKCYKRNSETLEREGMNMAKALTPEEKLAGARSFGGAGITSAIAFIKSNYGDEGVKKYLAFFAKEFLKSEQWKKTPGEGALKALNYTRGFFQAVGNDIKVLEESPRKVVFQATACGASKAGIAGPGAPLCEFCGASFLEMAKQLGWKATAKTGKIPCQWSVATI
jgi:hypothetical protein